jgi:hypothetical protein
MNQKFLSDLLKTEISINRLRDDEYFIDFFDKINFCPKTFVNHKIKSGDKLLKGKYKDFLLETEINIDLDIKKIVGTFRDDLASQYILDSIFCHIKFEKNIKITLSEGVDKFINSYRRWVLNKDITFDYFCDQDEFYVNGDGNHRTIIVKIISESDKTEHIIKNVQVNCYKVNKEYYKHYQLLKKFCKKYNKYEINNSFSDISARIIHLNYNGLYPSKYRLVNENEIENFLRNECSLSGCFNRCLGGFLHHYKNYN